MKTREPSWLLLVVHCISIPIFQKNALDYHFCHGCLCSYFSFESGIEISFLLYVVLQQFEINLLIKEQYLGVTPGKFVTGGVETVFLPSPHPIQFQRKIWDFSIPKPLNTEVHTTHKYNSMVRCCRISNGITASARRLFNLLFSTDQGYKINTLFQTLASGSTKRYSVHIKIVG